MLLSIIIPCYNSARFIAATIEMLIRQGLDNCELILVNDGSTDETLQILQPFAEYNKNIHVINQPNKGVSAARNAGIDAAQGQYIYFLDSDDTLSESSIDFFKKVLAANSSCQMYAFGYESRRDGTVIKRYISRRLNDVIFSGSQLTHLFFNKTICIHICASIYNRKFLTDNDFKFKEGLRIGEDLHFMLRVMMAAESCYYSNRLTFIYQLRDDSTMQGYKKYNHINLQAFIEIEHLLRHVPAELISSRNFFVSYYYISHIVSYIQSSNDRDKVIEQKLEHYHSVLLRPLKGVSFKKAIIIIARYIPPIAIIKYIK